MKKLATLLTVLFALAAVDARANLIVNGSFETPAVPVGGSASYGYGSTSITGWTTTTAYQNSVVSGSFSQNGISYPAEDGSQWLDLDNDLEQTVATTIGDVYTLSFWLGNVDDPGPYSGQSTQVTYTFLAVRRIRGSMRAISAMTARTRQPWYGSNLPRRSLRRARRPPSTLPASPTSTPPSTTWC